MTHVQRHNGSHFCCSGLLHPFHEYMILSYSNGDDICAPYHQLSGVKMGNCNTNRKKPNIQHKDAISDSSEYFMGWSCLPAKYSNPHNKDTKFSIYINTTKQKLVLISRSYAFASNTVDFQADLRGFRFDRIQIGQCFNLICYSNSRFKYKCFIKKKKSRRKIKKEGLSLIIAHVSQCNNMSGKSAEKFTINLKKITSAI